MLVQGTAGARYGTFIVLGTTQIHVILRTATVGTILCRTVTVDHYRLQLFALAVISTVSITFAIAMTHQKPPYMS